MKDGEITQTRMWVARLVAVVAAGGVAYAAVSLLDSDPLPPAIVIALIVLCKVGVTYRSGSRE